MPQAVDQSAQRELVALPPPSADLILWRVTLEALLAGMSRKKGMRLLRAIADKVANEEVFAQISPIRKSPDRAALSMARKQAAEVFSRSLPVLLARLK